MNKCEHYNIETREVRSNSIEGKSPNYNYQIPWCAHPNSPAPVIAIDSMGFEKRLTCGGDLAKCQVK